MNTQEIPLLEIKAIIGLGNPGTRFKNHRHNIGFAVVDTLCRLYQGSWQEKGNMEVADIMINNQKILLVKPLTFMNDSGKVIPALQKKGIKPENILVVHDELEIPFGKLKIRVGGSHRGHNGLRSIISVIGPDFARLRFGIGRPENKEDVPDYVLQNFEKSSDEVEKLIQESIVMIENLCSNAP